MYACPPGHRKVVVDVEKVSMQAMDPGLGLPFHNNVQKWKIHKKIIQSKGNFWQPNYYHFTGDEKVSFRIEQALVSLYSLATEKSTILSHFFLQKRKQSSRISLRAVSLLGDVKQNMSFAT